nr:uncharacterized protein LOC123748188 [Procambarus clarkii]
MAYMRPRIVYLGLEEIRFKFNNEVYKEMALSDVLMRCAVIVASILLTSQAAVLPQTIQFAGLGAIFAQSILPKRLLPDDTACPSSGAAVEHLEPVWLAGLVLEAASQPSCFITLIHHANSLQSSFFTEFSQLAAPWGVSVFEVSEDGQDANLTLTKLSRVVGMSRRVRQVSWCATVVVVSDDLAFLATFAQWSLKGRLLVWSTRLLVVTRLPLHHLQVLVSSHWTFSMMNAMLLVLDEWSRIPSVSVYVNLPYSASGARIVRTACWTAARGLLLPTYPLFPDKFNNFYGATVNVTALSYRPYWSEAKDQGSGGVTRYSGSDAQMLMTIAEVLNFTFNVLPVTTWDQVTGLVSERSSFMATIYHVQMPQRQLLYDYTYIYQHDTVEFTLATPSLMPNWQSLYAPLTDTVWASVLASLLLVPVLMFLIGRPKHGEEHSGGISMADAAEIAVGALLGQGTNKHLPGSSSSRVLLVTWLVFSFVVGTVYRGNLTAALTMPKYPPRPETLQQLVKAVHKVTMPSFGESFRQFFKQSDSEVFQALSRLMEIVPSAEYGLQQVVEKK